MAGLTYELESESEDRWKHSETDQEEAMAKKAMAATNAKAVKICSCGHYTCPLQPRFGHPVPVFKEDIEPLWPQSTRDKRAIELKGAKA